MDSGQVSLVAVTDIGSVEALKAALGRATKVTTRQANVDAADLQQELQATS
jgi:hypothetical protein